jgi:hypothetical protein
MRISYQNWIDRLNGRLILFAQVTRVVEYGPQRLTLSDGVVLSDTEFGRFKKRVMNVRTDMWVKNVDKLLSGALTEKQIKSILASIGGRAVQEKCGDAAWLHLNTGIPWNAGTKGQQIGSLGPRTQETKEKISRSNSGTGNGMYGVKMSDTNKELRSKIMKDKILAGNFTPNSNNRNTHWDAVFNNKKYRSSWEALYQFINPLAEYEHLRIEYEIENERKIYIVDFIDHKNKQVIEVKPRELCNGKKFQAKMTALQNWAANNGYEVLIVDKEWLQEQKVTIDYNRFDGKTGQKIKALYETGKKN